MNAYVPKVGDKVRATLGESVIVGEVSRSDGAGGIAIDVAVCSRLFIDPSGDTWQFEQIVSVPSKFGAVIRRADGATFALAEPRNSDGWFANSPDRWAEAEEATAGGFSVLFDGVDE